MKTRLPVPPLAVIVVGAFVVFGNALAVVYSAARNRALFAQVTALRERHDQLSVRRGQLELEEWTLAAHARVARLAQSELGMQPPDKVKIVEVR